MYTELCREASRWKSRIIPETLVSEARCDNDESRCRSIQARGARCWAGACRMCDLAADRIRLAAAGGGPGMVHRLTGFEQFHTQGRPPLGRNRRCRNKPGKANRINMKTRINLVLMLALALTLIGATLTIAQQTGSGPNVPPPRPKGPCDIYAAAGDPCVAAHSTTRALYASYNGPLYQVLRQSDGKTMDIGVVKPAGSDAGGYANAATQDAFCANTYCWITTIYDQSGKGNHLTQPPRGGFSGPAMGGFDNVPIADMAPITIGGHKVYGVFIEPGMGLREDDAKGTAVDDQAEGQYWVINGQHYNAGCCFDYGNAEIDSRDDGNGTMETTYYGDSTGWYHGTAPGPWIMTDQENNLVGCANPDGSKLCALP